MSLAPGSKLGPYEIVAPLGAGGMGEVWRARDPRLGREVALKVLPAAFAQDPERIARFEREAKLLASLNHPRIGALYGLEESEGRRVLVLELVAGESLADRLRRGALPVDEALPIASQVAGALEAAHESGVVHRDLKPGNVMLKPDGTVKVLDFGLAKAGAAEGSASDPKLSASPTMTYARTEAGVILGTAAYMSPEQARGRAVDRRSDIWSFGCVLYELLTGRQAFSGETVSDTVASILKSEPEWSALPDATPRRVRELLRRCLRKDASTRLRDIGDARIELDEVMAAPEAAEPVPAVAGTPRLGGRALVPLVAMGALALLAIAFAAWTRGQARSASAGGPMRFTLDSPPGITTDNSCETFSISPDGTTIAFVGRDSTGTGSVWLRKLDALSADRLPGTENTIGLFWAPDSRQLALFADGKLKKVGVADGVVRVLCDAPDPRGGSWGSRGTIVFAPVARGPLLSVSAEGGDPEVVATADSTKREDGFRYPAFLPDGEHFLFTSLPRRQGKYDIWVGRLGSSAHHVVMRTEASPVWAGAGCVITQVNDRLVAQRIDPASGAPKGRPVDLGDVPLILGHDGCYAVTASNDGKLLYCSGSLANTELVWLDRAGHRIGSVPVPAGRWESFALSPDAARVLAGKRISAAETQLWVLDVATGQGGPIGSASPQAGMLWAPDGRTVVYQADRDGNSDLYLRPAEGGPERRLVPGGLAYRNPWQWLPDGASILVTQANSGTNWDAMSVPVDGSHPPVPLVATPANEFTVLLSPDGHWLLYGSDASGRGQLYIRSYPAGDVRRQLTTTGFSILSAANVIDWSRDGREVIAGSSDMMAYPIVPGATLGIGPARRLFTIPAASLCMNVAPDHQRFLVSLPLASATPTQLAVEANWTAALRGH